MDWYAYIPFVQNASLLLVLSVIVGVVYLLPLRLHRTRLVVTGVLTALVCLAIMTIPYELQPGIVFDTRSILISATAFAFGFIPAAITVAAAIVYRLLLGGAGMVAGFFVILTSALIGLFWRRYVKPSRSIPSWLNVYLMSLTVHLVMIVCMLFLPYPSNAAVIRAILLPVLLVYPVADTLVCVLLLRQHESIRLQEELKQSEERFRTLFEHAPLGYQSLSADGTLENVNQQWLNMLGYTREEVIGKQFGEFVSPEFLDGFREKFAQFKARGKIQCEMAMITKAGAPVYIHFEGSIRFGAMGEVLQAHCILQDMTVQRETQKNLGESEKKYRSYIQNAPYAIVIVNQYGQVVELNDATVRITGYSGEKLQTMAILDLISAESMDEGLTLFQTLIALGAVSGELQYINHDGVKRWANISAVKLAEDRYLCFMSDISEHKWATENLLYQSTHDTLTGLWNRRFFDMECARLDAEAQLPLSILIGDINGLKLINDSFGRAEGDRIIKETAKFIGGYCRPGDVLARTGGDEFSILLPQTDLETAIVLMDRIQAACRERNETIADDSLHIHLALGVATREAMAETMMEAVKRAENSMNQRKLLEERSSHSSIIATIKATMREKSHETEAHEERIAQLARKVGVILGLPQSELDYMELFAELHDIGKVGISEQILNKPDRLTDDEWLEMRKHPEIGERIAMTTASLAPIAYYILCHHERWDGTGYPQKLSGYGIPLLSRILSIVDAYDAMTQDRVYQKAMTHEAALAEIRAKAGTQFDPHIAQIFCDDVFTDDADLTEGGCAASDATDR